MEIKRKESIENQFRPPGCGVLFIIKFFMENPNVPLITKFVGLGNPRQSGGQIFPKTDYIYVYIGSAFFAPGVSILHVASCRRSGRDSTKDESPKERGMAFFRKFSF